MEAQTKQRGKLDGVGLAVIANRLEGIVRNMQNTLVRTGRSGVLNIAKDCSCCLMTAGDELLAMAESLPIHVIAGPGIQARSMRELYPELRRGDAFLHNSPYLGNSHAADFCILVPVIDDDGVHRFTVLAKAHQADCGNALPTTYSSSARDVYEEGALIFPCVKVQEDYEHREDIIRMCRTRIRVPEQWWGDHLAMLGAARIGEQRMLELGREIGWDELAAYAEQWLDYSEERMTAAIRELPAGRIEGDSTHDPSPELPDGIPIKVGIDIKSDEGRIEIDLRDNPDCLPSGFNLTEATSTSAALLGLFNSIDHTVPQNAGSARRVEVLLRENCCVGIPQLPASCSVATTNLTDRVGNAVQLAMAGLGEGVGMAEFGFSFPASVAVISGKDPRHDDAPFINQIILAWTGGAASPEADGWLTACSIGDGGAIMRDSVELDELRYPILIKRQELVADTEGAGRRRGTPAALLEYGPIGTKLEVMYGSDGCVHGPRGARGGLGGACAAQFKRDLDGELHPEEPFGHVILEPGEMIVSYSCGAGGYGPPTERDPERVAADVAEGLISPERAESVYRVALDASGAVDGNGTRRLRA